MNEIRTERSKYRTEMQKIEFFGHFFIKIYLSHPNFDLSVQFYSYLYKNVL